MDLYQLAFKHYISHVDPEKAHDRAIRGLRLAASVPGGLFALRRFAPSVDSRLSRELWGLRFENPLGVAAGLDKEAEAYAALFALGFGHVEVGTVTPRPQPGNPQPRVWRLVEQRAVINAMGFPSQGSRAVLGRLGGGKARAQREANGHILGVNLGKNKDTPQERAAEDYAQLVETFFEVASYFVINISSPNTPGLRDLQLGDHLAALVGVAVAANARVAARHAEPPRPLLVKIAPDLEPDEIEAVSEKAVTAGAAGIVATNTTTSRAGLPAEHASKPGGLSGSPLFARSREVIARVYRTVGDRVPIIGVGGVASADQALAHIRAGASLVQLYTGFIYGGPLMIGRMLGQLSAAADREGWKSLDELVGIDSQAHLG